MEFATIATHEGSNQSRRDDLEQLGYAIADMMTGGKLDFINFNREEMVRGIITPQMHKKQIDLKKAFVEGKKLPPTFRLLTRFLQYVRNLKFDEDPNYDYLEGLLKNLDKGVEEYI